LIEVLVAALLLAGALVAMIGVYSTSTRQTKLNEYRSIATNLAINFAGRIQANASPTGENWTAYSLPLSEYSPQAASAPAAITIRPTGSVLPAGVTSVESLSGADWVAHQVAWNSRASAMATLDLQEMRNAVRTQLPYGDLRIVVNTADKGDRPSADMWLMWLPAESERSSDRDPRCPEAGAVAIAAGYFPECLYFRVVL
jgi:Tfp pilus assembly protein PilV